MQELSNSLALALLAGPCPGEVLQSKYLMTSPQMTLLDTPKIGPLSKGGSHTHINIEWVICPSKYTKLQIFPKINVMQDTSIQLYFFSLKLGCLEFLDSSPPSYLGLLVHTQFCGTILWQPATIFVGIKYICLKFCIFGHKFCILHCYVICMFVCCTSFHSPFAGHPLWPFESILLHHGQAPQPEAEAQKQNKTMHWRKTNKQNQTPTG